MPANNTVKNCKISKSDSDDLVDDSGGQTNTYENNKADPVVFL